MMRMMRLVGRWLCLIGLVITLAFPTNKASAQDSFAFVSLTYQAKDGQTVTIQNSTVVPRDVTTLTANFNAALDPASIKGLTLKDSTGTAVPLQNVLLAGSSNNTITAQVPLPLKRAETYTYTIPGGADGVKDAQGITMPQDVAITFQSQDLAYYNSITLPDPAQKNVGPQMTVYRFTAAQGPFRLQMNGMLQGNAMNVSIGDPTTNTELYSAQIFQSQTQSDPFIQYNLPKTGAYDLILIPIYAVDQTAHAQSLLVSANELTFPDTYIPPVSLRSMTPFQTMTAPFSVQPGLLNNGRTKLLELWLNDKIVASNLYQNGTINDYTIDPTSLQDGVYQIELRGESPDSPNQGVAWRAFYVDHTNTYSDVPASHWAHKPIEVLSHLGMLHGTGVAGKFAPGDQVTRAQFAVMMAGVLHLSTDATSPVTFADVPNDWSLPSINAMAASGLISGVSVNGKTYFYPKATISRQDACAIMGRALGISNYDVSNLSVPFPDFKDVKAYAQPSVAMLSSWKWVNGSGSPLKFHPNDTLNRGEAAQILSKFEGL